MSCFSSSWNSPERDSDIDPVQTSDHQWGPTLTSGDQQTQQFNIIYQNNQESSSAGLNTCLFLRSESNLDCWWRFCIVANWTRQELKDWTRRQDNKLQTVILMLSVRHNTIPHMQKIWSLQNFAARVLVWTRWSGRAHSSKGAGWDWGQSSEQTVSLQSWWSQTAELKFVRLFSLHKSSAGALRLLLIDQTQ